MTYKSFEDRIRACTVVNDKGCWIWQLHRNTGGYGKINMREGVFLVHRKVYEHYIAPFSKELDVCHKCDTPACCNPEHLFLGTAMVNVHDCIRKGRARKALGTDTRKAKLSNALVLDIRESRAKGESYNSIASRLGVVKGTIGHVLNGRAWKHV
jgi:hypothetical protein